MPPRSERERAPRHDDADSDRPERDRREPRRIHDRNQKDERNGDYRARGRDDRDRERRRERSRSRERDRHRRGMDLVLMGPIDRADFTDDARARSRSPRPDARNGSTRTRSPPRGPRSDKDRHREPPDRKGNTPNGTPAQAGARDTGRPRKREGSADVKMGGEDDEADEEARMKRVMGFGSFRTTKNTKVPGNDKNYGVRKEKKSFYRQYMNRQGGFNRPLSPS